MNPADVGAIGVDADCGLIPAGFPHDMDVDLARRHGRHLSLAQNLGRSVGDDLPGRQPIIGLRYLLPDELADDTPYGVVVDRCALLGTPHEAHHAKSLEWIAVEKVLAIAWPRASREFLR